MIFGCGLQVLEADDSKSVLKDLRIVLTAWDLKVATLHPFACAFERPITCSPCTARSLFGRDVGVKRVQALFM